MTIEQAATGVVTSIGMGVMVLLYSLYRRLFLDRFRDRLFRLREQWFNLALDPKSSLQFDSSLYGSVEQSLCGMLRFAHRISFLFVVIERISECLQNITVDVGPIEEITKRVKNIPDEYTRKRARRIWDDIPGAILTYLMLTSLLFALWTVGLTIILIVRQSRNLSSETMKYIKKHVVRTNERVLEKLESSAYREIPV